MRYVNYYENDWNLVLASDSYKMSHQLMLPNDLKSLESYGESRGGDYEYLAITGYLPILRMLQGVQITPEKVNEARWLATKHFGSDVIFDHELWMYICEKYDGRLPIKIYAVKEGTILKTKNAIFKTVPLEEKFADLASYIESILMRVWYPFTISSNSGMAADFTRYYANKSASNGYDWRFLLHDFGSRGVTTREQAQYGGAMHLLHFLGSDNFDGIRFLMKHYDNENWQKRFTTDFELKRGFSVPATEHLVMTIEGREKEEDVYRRLLKMFTETPALKNVILSMVSDTYDIFNVIDFLYTKEDLRNMIMSRDANTVLRPDSGDAFEVISKMLEMLSERFGYTYNEKGYKVLNHRIRILQGDGINLQTFIQLIQYFVDGEKWSIENFVFGSGGGLLMKFDRDTTKFAIKASWALFNDGREVNVYKDPITSYKDMNRENGGDSKKSKEGKLWTFRIDGEDVTYNEDKMKELGLTIEDSLFVEVFNCGNVLVDYTIEEVTDKLIKEYDRINLHQEMKTPQMFIDMNKNMIEQEKSWMSKIENGTIEDDNAYLNRIKFYINEINRLTDY